MPEAKTCGTCRFHVDGRCHLYPSFIGPHGVPDQPRKVVWSESDHPQVDPGQPGCGMHQP